MAFRVILCVLVANVEYFVILPGAEQLCLWGVLNDIVIIINKLGVMYDLLGRVFSNSSFIINSTQVVFMYWISNQVYLKHVTLNLRIIMYNQKHSYYFSLWSSLIHAIILICLFLPLFFFPKHKWILFYDFPECFLQYFTVYCNEHNHQFIASHNTQTFFRTENNSTMFPCSRSVQFHYFPISHNTTQ